MVKTTQEIIILAVIVVLFSVSTFVFGADGTLLFKLLTSSRDVAPDKREVVIRLDAFKTQFGKYPGELGRIGISRQYGSVLLEYLAQGERFELCYQYFPYLNGTSVCYDSQVREWQIR